MRVLFLPLAIPTHYRLQVPLAWAFRSAGHEVRIAAAGPQVVDAIVESGMQAVPLGRDFDSLEGLARGVRLRELPVAERDRLEEQRLDQFAGAAEILAADLLDFARWWRPDLVVADPLATVAPIVSELLGIPLVRHLFTVDAMRELGVPGSGAPVPGDPRDAWPDRLVALYDRFGVEVRADFADRTVDPCPPSVQLPGVPNQVLMRYVPYNGPGVQPDWVTGKRERPRVCVTWGTVTSDIAGEDSFGVPAILDALADHDVEVVAALSRVDRELLGEPRPGVRVIDPAPFHLLFPACDALIHHGGGATMLTAALQGIPQIIWPRLPDQNLNSARMEAAGASIAVAQECSASDLRAAVARLLTDDSVRAGAHRLRSEMLAQPHPSRVVRTLEELVRTHNPQRGLE